MLYSLRLFKQRMLLHKPRLRRFLTKIEKKAPKNITVVVEKINTAVWKEVDCLQCANCCKTMSPTYTQKDIHRIAQHLNMSIATFKKQWLCKDKSGDWVNTKQPCPFLQSNNMCSIYTVRPADCAGFPHLTKKKMVDYIHVHQQNVEYCPATYIFVEKMEKLWKEEGFGK